MMNEAIKKYVREINEETDIPVGIIVEILRTGIIIGQDNIIGLIKNEKNN